MNSDLSNVGFEEIEQVHLGQSLTTTSVWYGALGCASFQSDQ